jgi:biopolymer transport protein ExbD
MKTGRRLKRPERLNLVPILDSVFIFIFFLLMSAQFVEVYEIGSSVPMTQEVPEHSEKDPLNLTLHISNDQVVMKYGSKNPVSKTFLMSEKEKLREEILALKARFPEENTVILKSEPKVNFQAVVNVIDNTRAPAGSQQKYFEQVVFDNNGFAPVGGPP